MWFHPVLPVTSSDRYNLDFRVTYQARFSRLEATVNKKDLKFLPRGNNQSLPNCNTCLLVGLKCKLLTTEGRGRDCFFLERDLHRECIEHGRHECSLPNPYQIHGIDRGRFLSEFLTIVLESFDFIIIFLNSKSLCALNRPSQILPKFLIFMRIQEKLPIFLKRWFKWSEFTILPWVVGVSLYSQSSINLFVPSIKSN